jgi:hypothetical protein
MHLIYIDDSRDERTCLFSALALPVDQWHDAFQQMREFRHRLRRTYGIYVYKELHACEFVSGHGRPSEQIVTKWNRAVIFRQTLEVMARLPGARLFNAVFPRKDDERAFERLLEAINRTLRAWGSYAILICDEGKEVVYTHLVRRMYAYYPAPDLPEIWLDSPDWHDTPVDRVVEDPFFKDSAQSYFVQMVDFRAYALLRRERPVASKTRYGLDTAFDILHPILVRDAWPHDPEGIIRP